MDEHDETQDASHIDDPGVGHEKRDISVRIVVGFAASLVFAAIVIHVFVWLLFDVFGDLQTRAYPSEYPMVQTTGIRLPPSPRLQVKPREDLKAMRKQEDELLNSYTWINQQTGAVRIPISEAMKMVVQQGFPVAEQASPGQPALPHGSSSGRTRRRAREVMRNTIMKAVILAFLVVATIAVSPAPSFGQYNGVPANGMMTKGDQPAGVQPADLQKVAFDQKLNAQIPLDLPFRDETGRTVTLGDYFHHGRPVVLSLVYYDCPMLCTLVLNGVAGAMKGMSLNPGSDYDLVTVSFNPQETPALAAAKKKTYIERYGHPEAASAWHFLTGDEPAIERLTKAVGFHYVYDPRTKIYAHATGIMIVTADGRLSKYLYGIDYAPRMLRLALVDASSGRIGNPVDQVLLYCYHYDPSTGKYGLVVLNVIRLGGAVTFVGLAAFVLIMLGRERKRAGQSTASQESRIRPARRAEPAPERGYRGRRRGGLHRTNRKAPAMWPRLFPLFPERASTMAGRVDALYFFLIGVSAFFIVLIAALVVYFAYRYRRRRANEIGRPCPPGTRSRCYGRASLCCSRW